MNPRSVAHLAFVYFTIISYTTYSKGIRSPRPVQTNPVFFAKCRPARRKGADRMNSPQLSMRGPVGSKTSKSSQNNPTHFNPTRLYRPAVNSAHHSRIGSFIGLMIIFSEEDKSLPGLTPSDRILTPGRTYGKDSHHVVTNRRRRWPQSSTTPSVHGQPPPTPREDQISRRVLTTVEACRRLGPRRLEVGVRPDASTIGVAPRRPRTIREKPW